MTELNPYRRENLQVTGVRWVDGAKDGAGNTELLPEPVDDDQAEEFAILQRDSGAAVDSFKTRAEAEEYFDAIAVETEGERIEREAREAESAYRQRHGEVQALAREAAEAASRATMDAHKAELKELQEGWSTASRALREFIDRTAAHPLEGRFVERQVSRGRFSWDRKIVTERGRLEVRRVATRFADSVSSYDMPDLGTLFIRRLKADGSEGAKVVKVWRVNDDGTLATGGLGGGWKLSPAE